MVSGCSGNGGEKDEVEVEVGSERKVCAWFVSLEPQ